MHGSGAQAEPIFLFVNPKSGGKKGEKILQAPQPFEVALDRGGAVSLRIFSLLEGTSGDKRGFRELAAAVKTFHPIRVIVGGGDGTIVWAESEATKHGIDTSTEVMFGIVPLGTGNDFSRNTGWGGKNPKHVRDQDFAVLRRFARLWANAEPRRHDVWNVCLQVREEGDGGAIYVVDGKRESCEEKRSVTKPMVNYFSVGQESNIGMAFDRHRQKNQLCNLACYLIQGLRKECICWRIEHVADSIASLHMGVDEDGRVIFDTFNDGELPNAPALVGNPESLMFLNINSFAGGTAHFWQMEVPYGVRPDPPASDVEVEGDPGDGKLEVVTLPKVLDIVADRIEHGAKRVISGAPFYILFHRLEDELLHCYCQVDGEYYHLVNPQCATVTHFKQLWVLYNTDGQTSGTPVAKAGCCAGNQAESESSDSGTDTVEFDDEYDDDDL